MVLGCIGKLPLFPAECSVHSFLATLLKSAGVTKVSTFSGAIIYHIYIFEQPVRIYSVDRVERKYGDLGMSWNFQNGCVRHRSADVGYPPIP